MLSVGKCHFLFRTKIYSNLDSFDDDVFGHWFLWTNFEGRKLIRTKKFLDFSFERNRFLFLLLLLFLVCQKVPIFFHHLQSVNIQKNFFSPEKKHSCSTLFRIISLGRWCRLQGKTFEHTCIRQRYLV